jgi:chemotaxis protein MotB
MAQDNSQTYEYSGLEKSRLDAIFSIGPAERRPTAWFLPWSDLMMVMFILFVVLFVFAAKHNTLPTFHGSGDKARAGQESDDSDPVVREEVVRVDLSGIESRLNQSLDERIPTVTSDWFDRGRGLTVGLPAEHFFAAGSHELSAEGRKVLRGVAQELSLTNTLVFVTGYADHKALDGGGHESPWDLASLRASQVVRYFTEVAGLAPERFVIQGVGMHKPLVPNTTQMNWSRNQRVEIRITDEPY